MKKYISIIMAVLLICLTVTSCTSPANTTPTTTPAPAPTTPTTVNEADLSKVKASYEAKLNSYIDLMLTLGVALKEGDDLFIDGNIESYEIMNSIALRAYEKGAKMVYLNCKNKTLENANAKYLKDEAYVDYPFLPELLSGFVGYTRPNAKVIMLHDYFFEEKTNASEQELNDYTDKMLEARKTVIEKDPDFYDKLFGLNDPKNSIGGITTIAVPTKVWAKKIYPELNEEAAYYKLADDLFGFMYVTEQGSTLTEHLMEIAARRDAFNKMNIVSLHYSSPTVELEVPLHKNNKFFSMPFERNGDILASNIPSAEICGLPTKYGANGTVENTRPLVFNGSQVIDGIKLEFKDGKLVNYSVKENPEAFEAIMKQMPEGVYLGEIAMVSSDSPIFQSGKVYYSTLIDENSGAHLAIGSALVDVNLKDGAEIDDDVAIAADHHDIVIGSEDLKVTATLQDGSKVVLIQDGKWTSLNK